MIEAFIRRSIIINMVESNTLEEKPWVRPEPLGDKFALPVAIDIE